MDRLAVMAVARRLAEAQGRDLDAYEPPTAERQGASWHVRFAGRVPAPGNHFVVVVDDASGQAELFPGR